MKKTPQYDRKRGHLKQYGHRKDRVVGHHTDQGLEQRWELHHVLEEGLRKVNEEAKARAI